VLNLGPELKFGQSDVGREREKGGKGVDAQLGGKLTDDFLFLPWQVSVAVWALATR
jgi:hypothetical protein